MYTGNPDNSRNQTATDDLYEYLLLDSDSDGGLPDTFLAQMCERFMDDGLEDILGNPIIKLSQSLLSTDFTTAYMSALHVRFYFNDRLANLTNISKSRKSYG